MKILAGTSESQRGRAHDHCCEVRVISALPPSQLVQSTEASVPLVLHSSRSSFETPEMQSSARIRAG